jgi:putative endonuclease
MISTYNIGIFSEYAAIIFLKLKGYRILERRYKGKLGEIDIIASKRGLIVFLEVKTVKRRNKDFPIVSSKQINRIRRSSMIYLNKGYYHNYEIRFDLITVSNLIYINHYKNVF